MHSIRVTAKHREEMIEITGSVEEILAECRETEGVCFLFTQHTTCGLTINENADPDVQVDILSHMRKLIPQYGQNFRHFEPNSDAHVKTSLIGSSVLVPFSESKLLLGRWQGVFLCEFDGPRERTILMMIC